MADQQHDKLDPEVQELLDAADKEAAEASDSTDPVKDPGADTAGDDPVETQTQRMVRVASVVPLHAATGPVKRGRGRPRKINPKPTVSDLEYHAAMTEERAKFVAQDPVVKSTSSNRDAVDVMRQIKIEVAKEAAALLFQRVENEKFGKDSAQISSRRIAALKEIANIELEIKKLGVDMIDVRSEKFQKIVMMLIEKFRDVAQEVLTTEQFDLLFNKLQTSMENWEEQAEDILR